MEKVKVKIVNESGNALPEYQTDQSAGMDLRADIKNEVTLKPLQRELIGTGLYMELPEGFEAQIRPRSGLAIKHGISVLNTPGTIDADYRGEIKIILVNISDQEYVIKSGERIAQMIITRHARAEIIDSISLAESSRDAGGFGSTGIA